jgi:hypothetical protein
VLAGTEPSKLIGQTVVDVGFTKYGTASAGCSKLTMLQSTGTVVAFVDTLKRHVVHAQGVVQASGTEPSFVSVNLLGEQGKYALEPYSRPMTVSGALAPAHCHFPVCTVCYGSIRTSDFPNFCYAHFRITGDGEQMRDPRHPATICRACLRTHATGMVQEGKLFVGCPDPDCERALQTRELRDILTAPLYKKLISGIRDMSAQNDDEDEQLIASGFEIRMCPRCNCRMEKNDGCDSMNCFRCGENFNWRDAKRLEPKVRKHCRTKLIPTQFQLSEWMSMRKRDKRFVTPAVTTLAHASISPHQDKRFVYTGTDTGLIIAWSPTGDQMRTMSAVGAGTGTIVHQLSVSHHRIMFGCISEEGYAGPGTLKARRGQIRSFLAGEDVLDEPGLIEGDTSMVRVLAVSQLAGHESASTHTLFSGGDGRLKEWFASRLLGKLDLTCMCSVAADVVTIATGVNSEFVVTGGSDGLVRMWSERCMPIMMFQGHDSAITALTVGSDGTVYSGSEDQTIRVWERELIANTKEADFAVCFVDASMGGGGRGGALACGGGGAAAAPSPTLTSAPTPLLADDVAFTVMRECKMVMPKASNSGGVSAITVGSDGIIYSGSNVRCLVMLAMDSAIARTTDQIPFGSLRANFVQVWLKQNQQ